DRDAGRVALDQDVVVAVGGVDGDGVGLVVAAAQRAGQVEVDLGEVGAAHVADGDVVDAAPGVEVDALDAARVHGNGGDIAGEPHPAAVGPDADVLVNVGAVEQHR